jgi:hypothetical protein
MRAVLLGGLVFAAALVGCPQNEPNVPTEEELARGHITVGQPAGSGGPAGPAGDYLYIVKRGIVVVGLADEKRMGREVAEEITRKTADVFEACVTEQIPRGAPSQGAARAAVKLTDDGNVIGVLPRVDDVGNLPMVAVVLRCLKAPLTLMAYPAADADAGTGDRGFAVEVLWK